MPGYVSSKVSGQFIIKVPTLDLKQMVELGGHAINSMRQRANSARNVYDNPAKPYSPRGPIYVPISGRGTITRGLTSDTIKRGQVGNIVSFDAGKKTVTLKRNKSTLGGREVLTVKDLSKLRAKGIIVLKKGAKTPKGGGKLIVRDTGKSIKFANWAEYKRALGKSGLRDLELSGRMLNAIVIARSGEGYVELSFAREEEHKKAQGNNRIDPWWGLSPSNQAFVLGQAARMLAANITAANQKAG